MRRSTHLTWIVVLASTALLQWPGGTDERTRPRERVPSPRSVPAARAVPAPEPAALPSIPASESWPAVTPVASSRGDLAAGELIVAIAGADRAPAIEADIRARLPILAARPLASGACLHVRLEEDADLDAARDTIGAIEGVTGVTTNAIFRATGRARARGWSGPMWNALATGLTPRDAATPRPDRAPLVIALLDSGIAAGAPGLADVEIVAPHDAIDGDADPADGHGHGTFLANLLVGRPGLAGDSALMPVRVLSEDLVGTEAALVDGIHHAVMYGADVINLSLVFGASYLPTRMLDAAIADALANGVVVVAAAGNDAGGHVRYPAAFPGVVAVGASTPASRDGRLARAPYSSTGAALDVLAPGGDLDADANGDGLPDGILAESFDPARPGEFGPWLYAGTSQAAAHATAAAAQLLAAGHAPAQVPAQLRESAQEHGEPGFDRASGAGLLRVAPATHREVREVVIGVQALVAFRTTDSGTAGGAWLSIVDSDGAPGRGARVYTRMRGAAAEEGSCVTDRDGVCLVDGGSVAQSPAIVILEVQAVTLRDGRTTRPHAIATHPAADAAHLALTDGGGWGSSSILWSVDARFLSTWWMGSFSTFQLFGAGEGSALPPTVIALDAGAAAMLRGDDGDATGGTGFGSSSIFWFTLRWDRSFMLSAPLTWGGGFGSSSILWSGWSFAWYFQFQAPSTWGTGSFGSPLHDVVGASRVGIALGACER